MRIEDSCDTEFQRAFLRYISSKDDCLMFNTGILISIAEVFNRVPSFGSKIVSNGPFSVKPL